MSPTRRSKPPPAAAAASSAPPPVVTRRRTSSKDNKVSSAADYIRSVMEQLQKSSSSSPPPPSSDLLLPLLPCHVPTTSTSAPRDMPVHDVPQQQLASPLPQPPPLRAGAKSAKMSRKPNYRPSCNNNDKNASFGSCATATTIASTDAHIMNPNCGQQVWLMIVERMREEIIKARDMHRADLMMSAEKKKQQQQRNDSKQKKKKKKKKRMKVGELPKEQSSQRRQPSGVEDDDDDDESDGDSPTKLCTVCCSQSQAPGSSLTSNSGVDPSTTAAAAADIADSSTESRRAVAVTVCGHFLCWPCLCRWHNSRVDQQQQIKHSYGGAASANPTMSSSSAKKECPCCKKILSKNQVTFLGADKEDDDEDDDDDVEEEGEEAEDEYGDNAAAFSRSSYSSSSRRRRGRSSRATSMAALATDQRDKLLQAAALPILASTLLLHHHPHHRNSPNSSSSSRSLHSLYDTIGGNIIATGGGVTVDQLHSRRLQQQNVAADSVIMRSADSAAAAEEYLEKKKKKNNNNNNISINSSVSLATTMCPSVRKRSKSVARPSSSSACKHPLAANTRDVGRDPEKVSRPSCSVDHMITDSDNYVINHNNKEDAHEINASCSHMINMESDDHGDALVLCCCRSSGVEDDDGNDDDDDDEHRHDFEVISMAPTTSLLTMSSPSTAAEDHHHHHHPLMISPQDIHIDGALHHHHHHPTAAAAAQSPPALINTQYSRANNDLASQSPELHVNFQTSSEVAEDDHMNLCRLQPITSEGLCSVTTTLLRRADDSIHHSTSRAERQVLFSSGGDDGVLLQDNYNKTSCNQQATAKYSSAMIVRPDVLLDELGGNYSSYDMNLYRAYHVNDDNFDSGSSTGCAAAVGSFCAVAAENNNSTDLTESRTCFSTRSADQKNSVIASLEGSYNSSSNVNYNATSLFLNYPSHFIDDGFSSNLLNDVDRVQLINPSISQLHSSYYIPAPYDTPHTPHVQQQIYDDSMQAAAVSFTATNYTASLINGDVSIFNAANVISPLTAAQRSTLTSYLNHGQPPYAHDVQSTLSPSAASTRSSSSNQILSAGHVDDALSDWSFMQQYNDWDWTQIASAGIFP